MNIETRVKQIISELLEVNADSIDTSQKLIELGADSLAAIEVVVAIETEFGVEVPEDFDPNTTIQTVIDYIKNNT